ncbi:MAG: Ni/Fe-hydrogenase subunit HybB-like protein [Kiritimatiellia bacterium]|jgi:Ni/Fe-hydrogenase subunit HybB-like protein
MDTHSSWETGPTDANDQTHALWSYPRFLWEAAKVATDGNFAYYAWMTLLTAVWLVGVNAWMWQLSEGQGITAMSDHVSWGMYIGNFTYGVGLAAGAVMMVIPAYIYKDRSMHDVVIVGELLAIAAVAVCVSFVSVDMGRVDRLWHMMPGIGVFHWPVSMLTWDVIVLSGYGLLNLHIVGYLLYMRYLGRKPNPRWYLPFVFTSIIWAVSIHTVTAFLYSGLGGRPFWNSAILAPRFIASAFVTGPAFIYLALQIIRRVADLPIGNRPLKTLLNILRVTVLLNLFLVGSEVFTEFYTGGAHVAAAEYLYFGLHGKMALVPWIWTAITCNVVAAGIFLLANPKKHLWTIDLACMLTLFGLWVEKGLGLIVPGFVPSTLHEVVEYLPNLLEWKISVGIWAMGLIIFTVGLKIAVAVFKGTMHVEKGGT